MRPYGILEMVQTGLVALERGDGSMDVPKVALLPGRQDSCRQSAI